jgi:hypothetical protein
MKVISMPVQFFPAINDGRFNDDTKCAAAIITKVNENGSVNLTVFGGKEPVILVENATASTTGVREGKVATFQTLDKIKIDGEKPSTKKKTEGSKKEKETKTLEPVTSAAIAQPAASEEQETANAESEAAANVE